MGLLFNPPPELLFRSLGAHKCGWVSDVQGLPGYKHVATGVLRVGAVPLLQYHYRILNLAVHEMDLEGGLTQGPAWEILHGARHFTCHPRE